MTAKVFHKLDAFFHFLPKFYMPIDAGCYNEIGFCHHNMSDNIAMHVTLLVTVRVWQIFQIELLVM